MRTAKHTAPMQPRFMLRVHRGHLSYACRTCNHRYHHVARMMEHLQVSQAR